MRRSALAALIAATAMLPVRASMPATSLSYMVDRWTTADGLPNHAVTAAVTGSDGYLWIATWAGVVKFDGARFTPLEAKLPNDHATALLAARDGAMWVGVSGSGVARVDGGEVTIVGPAQGFTATEIRAFAEDPRGRIWAATDRGLARIANGRSTMIGRALGLPADDAASVAVGADGHVWVASTTEVCDVSDAASIAVSCARPFAFAGTPRTLLVDRNRRLWIGTTDGLFTPRGRTLARRRIDALLHSTSGAVWAGLRDGVAQVRDSAVVEEYDAAAGLKTGSGVSALFEDAEGSIWITDQNGGLSRLRRKRVRMFSKAEGLAEPVIGSVVQDRAGGIWALPVCGPVSQLEGDRFVPRFEGEFGGHCPWVMLAARDGTLWFGGRNGPLMHWSGGRMERFDSEDGLSDDFITALFEDHAGVIWIGTVKGGLHRYEHGRLSRAYREADGVATQFIVAFAEDRDGRVWIGSNANGLSVYEHGAFRQLAPEESPPSRNVSGLFVDSRGDLWIATAANGLYRRRRGTYESFGPAQGLDKLIAIVLEDTDGNLWVSTARGIARLARDRIEAVASGGAASLEPIFIDEGLINPEGSGGGFDPSGLRDDRGRLWISTIDGLAMVDPHAFALNTIVPRVRVESIAIAGLPPSNAGAAPVHVPAGTTSFEIAYTAFSLLRPEKVRFRYRVIGLDTRWADAGPRRVAYFNRLAPGTYRFEVLASNNDGLWTSSPATLEFLVAPFWWERRSVQALGLVFALGTIGVAVYSVMARRARARLAVLERISGERSRIARDLHDDLGARLVHISLLANGGAAPSAPVADAAREALQTMDELVWAVNAKNDTLEGFATYAARYAEELLETAGIGCRLQIQPDLHHAPLSATTRRNVYLAFKEGLTNAVKHARANEIRIAIHATDATFTVEIADDGAGFRAAELDPTGNGVMNMAERMKNAGGTFDYTTAPGRGTHLIFRVPIGT